MDEVHLIYKVLQGNASKAENDEFKIWINARPENKSEFEDLKMLFDSSLSRADSHIPEKQFYEGLYQIKETIKSRHPIQQTAWILATGLGILFILIVMLLIVQTPQESISTDSITFNEMPLREITHLLENIFPVRIEVQNVKLLDCKFTGTFHHASTPEEIIKTLAQTMSLEYTLDDSGKFQLTGLECIDR